MQTYTPPLRDMRFVLHELHDSAALAKLPGLEEMTPDVLNTVLEEAGKFISATLLPLNASGDAEGCRYEDGVVRTPKGFKEAYKAFVEGGWGALSSGPEYGGQGLPQSAAKLLDDAGFPLKDGTRMTLRLIADAGVELNRKACEILKEQLAQVGVKVDLQLVERNVMLDRVYVKRDYDMHVHGFSTGADPAIDVSRLYVSTNIRPVSFTNGAGYRNPKVDELFMKGQAAIKPEDRTKAYREVQKVLTDEVPAIWLVEYGIVGVWSKKLHGLHTWSAYSYYQFWDTWSDGGKGQ